jgi:hypothetical protein
MLCGGRKASPKLLLPDQPKHLHYLVDNGLSPGVAEALRAVGYTSEHVKTQFPQYPDGSADDAIILEHCFRTQTIWITTDERREKLMRRFPSETSKTILLVLKQPQKFPASLQLKIVMRVIDEVERKVHSSHGGIHFKAGQAGRAQPTTIWAQHAEDWPKDF